MFPIVDSALIEIDYTEEYKIDFNYTALLIKEDLYINQHKERIHEIATKTYTNTITKRFGFENVATLPSWKKNIGNIKLNKNCPGVSARAIFYFF